ncbi:MAG TPA: heavy-metal-associated domain-containing protein [Bacillota bacterium]|nr:heavy-metal-associated domain-containing protein [Bacillota bacterium]
MMKNVSFQLEELTCPSCVKKIETMVKGLKGVLEVKVLFNSSKVKVSYNETVIQDQEIGKNISALGYEVLGQK